MNINDTLSTPHQKVKVFKHIVLLGSLLLFISGCSFGGKSNPAQFYVLDAKLEEATKSDLSSLRIGVGPIVIPGYIDRPQIVTKTETAEVHLAEFNRWAEPMGEMFTRTLSENITATTGSHHVYSYPWTSAVETDYRITAKVIKFENNSNGDALLSVHWLLRNETDNNVEPITSHSEFKANSDNNTYSARVAALNDTLAQFAQEIVKHIK